MNLYELLSNFWRIDELECFSGNDSKLYFFLLHLANRSFWPKWIEYPNNRLSASVGISIDVLKSSRNKLQESSLITFTSGGGHKVRTKYQILAPKPDPKSEPYLISNKYKRHNTYSNGNKKGFVHSGSDFD